MHSKDILSPLSYESLSSFLHNLRESKAYRQGKKSAINYVHLLIFLLILISQ
jgi:hypothetical protein